MPQFALLSFSLLCSFEGKVAVRDEQSYIQLLEAIGIHDHAEEVREDALHKNQSEVQPPVPLTESAAGLVEEMAEVEEGDTMNQTDQTDKMQNIGSSPVESAIQQKRRKENEEGGGKCWRQGRYTPPNFKMRIDGLKKTPADAHEWQFQCLDLVDDLDKHRFDSLEMPGFVKFLASPFVPKNRWDDISIFMHFHARQGMELYRKQRLEQHLRAAKAREEKQRNWTTWDPKGQEERKLIADIRNRKEQLLDIHASRNNKHFAASGYRRVTSNCEQVRLSDGSVGPVYLIYENGTVSTTDLMGDARENRWQKAARRLRKDPKPIHLRLHVLGGDEHVITLKNVKEAIGICTCFNTWEQCFQRENTLGLTPIWCQRCSVKVSGMDTDGHASCVSSGYNSGVFGAFGRTVAHRVASAFSSDYYFPAKKNDASCS